jgi:hypothetical protein
MSVYNASRRKTPFHVYAYPGDLLGKFCNEHQALRVAAMWSAHYQAWTEVVLEAKNGGLVGQFSKGALTPEFAHRHDDVWPHVEAA